MPPRLPVQGRGQTTIGGSTLHYEGQREHQTGMPEVWQEDGFQVQPFPPLNVDQGEGCSTGGEAGQRGVLDSLQLWQSLHWQDQAEAGNSLKMHVEPRLFMVE